MNLKLLHSLQNSILIKIVKWSRQEESLLEMKNIVSKAKDCTPPTFKVEAMARKKKKNDDHNLTAVLRRGVADKSEVLVLWFPQDSGGQSLSSSGVFL